MMRLLWFLIISVFVSAQEVIYFEKFRKELMIERKNLASFEEAQKRCEESYGHLFFDKNKILHSFVAVNLKRFAVHSLFYIGLHYENNTWKWIDGKQIDESKFVQWTNKKTMQSGISHYCTAINISKNFAWEVVDCDVARQYICERTMDSKEAEGRDRLSTKFNFPKIKSSAAVLHIREVFKYAKLKLGTPATDEEELDYLKTDEEKAMENKLYNDDIYIDDLWTDEERVVAKKTDERNIDDKHNNNEPEDHIKEKLLNSTAHQIVVQSATLSKTFASTAPPTQKEDITDTTSRQMLSPTFHLRRGYFPISSSASTLQIIVKPYFCFVGFVAYMLINIK